MPTGFEKLCAALNPIYEEEGIPGRHRETIADMISKDHLDEIHKASGRHAWIDADLISPEIFRSVVRRIVEADKSLKTVPNATEHQQADDDAFLRQRFEGFDFLLPTEKDRLRQGVRNSREGPKVAVDNGIETLKSKPVDELTGAQQLRLARATGQTTEPEPNRSTLKLTDDQLKKISALPSTKQSLAKLQALGHQQKLVTLQRRLAKAEAALPSLPAGSPARAGGETFVRELKDKLAAMKEWQPS